MTPARLHNEADLEEVLASDRLLLFKHSPTCPVSAQAFFEYQSFCDEHPGTATLWLDVIEQRPASNAITAATGVTHESPHALWLLSGAVAWHASHGAITRASLAAATVNA